MGLPCETYTLPCREDAQCCGNLFFREPGKSRPLKALGGVCPHLNSAREWWRENHGKYEGWDEIPKWEEIDQRGQDAIKSVFTTFPGTKVISVKVGDDGYCIR